MADVTTEIQKLYVAYFSRAADVDGLQYWNGILSGNPNGYQLISQTFSASAEYKAAYSQSTNEQVVQAVYHNLFGRDGEAAGVTYWTDLLNRHAITIDNVVTQVAAGALGNDAFVYDARVSISKEITAHLDQPFEAQAYTGTHSNQLVVAYLSNVRDQLSAANAVDPGAVDNLISKMVTDAGTHAASPDVAQLVGTAPPHTADGMF